MPANLHDFITMMASLTVWLVLLVIVFVPLERLFALHASPVWRKGAGTDVAYYFVTKLVTLFVVAVALSVPIAAMVAGLKLIVPEAYYDGVAALPVWLKAVLAFVVAEIGFYWGHRWSHRVPFLWRCHAVHHSAEHMDFLVNSRAHPVDLVFTRLCGMVPMYALGLAGANATGAATAALIMFVSILWGFFIHANLRWRFGPLEWLVATPAFHHWHHTRKEPFDRNFASTLPVIDRVFGTHHLPREWPEAYGTDTDVGTTMTEHMLRPLQRPTSAAVQPL